MTYLPTYLPIVAGDPLCQPLNPPSPIPQLPISTFAYSKAMLVVGYVGIQKGEMQ